MRIANPIYDVVFRYLMDDNRVAKLIISAIIGEEVKTLAFRTTERSVRLQQHSFTVYRLDFAATIKTDKGDDKKVLIEIQKAKFSTDISRFRKYLGQEYSKPDNEGSENEKNAGEINDPSSTYLPIVTIYFLGYPLKHTKAPVVRVNRRYIDAVTGEEIFEREEFIESLTHDSFIVQIPYLSGKRQNELLSLLSVFDQNQRTQSEHILNINEKDFPEKYREVIRRLQIAIAEQEVREEMEMEDEIVRELEAKERLILKYSEDLETQEKILQQYSEERETQEQVLLKYSEDLETQEKILQNYSEKFENQEQVLHKYSKDLETQEKILQQYSEERETREQVLQKYSEDLENEKQKKEDALQEIERLRKMLEQK